MLRTGAALLIALTAHGADPKATVAGPLFAGGPGTNDPGHIVYRGASLTYLLMTAYKLKGFQLSGPKWMDTARFYIDAKLPSGATKDDLRAMLRNLLAERFGVTVHSEKKELQSYTLLVSKRGVRMKPSPPIAADTDGTAQHLDIRAAAQLAPPCHWIPCQSCRSIRFGSTRVARHAGTAIASIAAAVSTPSEANSDAASTL